MITTVEFDTWFPPHCFENRRSKLSYFYLKE